MAQIILSDCRVFAGGYNVSGDLNAIALNDAPDMLPDTHFGHTAKSRKKGLDYVTLDLEGYFNAVNSDKFFSTLGTVDVPITVSVTSTVGSAAYSFKSQNVEYTLPWTVGEMAKFSVKAETVGSRMVRGWLLENGGTARTSSGTGAIVELIEATAAKFIYGTLHITAAATQVGDTLDVIIESDALVTFLSPTTRLTFNQVLGNGGVTYNWEVPVAGNADGDTFWRCKWTIVDAGAVDASFTMAVFLGIE